MKILITGGAGFIGSAVIRHCLRQTDHTVLNIDKLTYASDLRSLDETLPSERYTFRQMDICNGALVREALRQFQPNAVIHLAAESHVDRSIDGPDAFIHTNILGTFSLLEATRDYFDSLTEEAKQSFRFHHVSTDEVYGSLGEAGLFSECTPYAPNSPYSASKASSDMLVRAWHHTYGLPVVTTNCSNNYGPYQFPEKLIPVVILAASCGKPIPVYGTGNNIRDWLFVDDHARALLAVLERGRTGETYNIGGHNEISNLELVRSICKVLDEFLPERAFGTHEELVTFVPDRPGHDRRYAIDASKIEREIGWRPAVGVEQGIRQTVSWYLENQWWWGPIQARGAAGSRLGLANVPRSAHL